MLRVTCPQPSKLPQAVQITPHEGTTLKNNNNNEVSSPQVIQYPGLVLCDLDFKHKLANLKRLANEIQIINTIAWTLEWDSSINMPRAALESRAWQMSHLVKLSHETVTSEEMKNLIEYFEEETNCSKLNKCERALLREVGSQYKREKYIPTALLQELTSTVVTARDAWAKAYENKDFPTVAPILQKIISLKQKIAQYIGYKGSPYNALLEIFEPGMNTDTLDKLFGELKNELIPVIRKINSLSKKTDTSFLDKRYNPEKQLELSKELLKHIQFDFSRGRLDESDCPFSLGISPNDVRLTTEIFEDNIYFSIANALHEGGHGMYDLGFNPALATTPLFDASSLGMHESQALLHETIVGKGLPFWKFYFPKLQERFPEELKGVSLEEFYKAMNNVKISFTWSESDEVTYNLHIMILYEAEKALIEGKLCVNDVPDFWRRKVKEYFGVEPPDGESGTYGSYWSCGDIGYYPTYTLGNLYAAQIYNTIKKEIPDIEEQIAKGNLIQFREWLQEKIHKHGRTETPFELMTRVTGEPITSKYFIEYIKNKYSNLYSLDLK